MRKKQWQRFLTVEQELQLEAVGGEVEKPSTIQEATFEPTKNRKTATNSSTKI